jgi:hypothetical protein
LGPANDYRIQLGVRSPPFNGVVMTAVSPEQALVFGTESQYLTRKEAIELVPPHEVHNRLL